MTYEFGLVCQKQHMLNPTYNKAAVFSVWTGTSLLPPQTGTSSAGT